MYTLSQLKCFVAVAEELHFGRAAARLCLTQPPLSRQLALLEGELGIRLLERNSHGVTLTAAGAVFLRDARRLLRDAEASAAAARLAALGQLGHLSIGFTASATYEILPALIRAFRRACPQVGLSLSEAVTGAQIGMLRDGRIDVGLVRPTLDLGQFEFRRIATDRLVAAIPATHALAARERLELEDLDGMPMIGHSPAEAGYFHELLTEVFRKARVHPILVHFLAQPHAQLAMVRSGIGIAIVTGSVRRHSIESDLVFREFSPRAAMPPVEMFLVWRKDHASPALENFLPCAIDVLSEPAASS